RRKPAACRGGRRNGRPAGGVSPTDGGRMTLQSMTGFARSVANHDGSAIAWEVKSVNGRGIELRFRLPPGFERLEPAARQAVQKRVTRRRAVITSCVGFWTFMK